MKRLSSFQAVRISPPFAWIILCAAVAAGVWFVNLNYSDISELQKTGGVVGPRIAEAATWQGNQYGIYNYSGYPMPLDCYDYQDYSRNYGNLPNCTDSNVVAEFSLHQAGVANGITQFTRATSGGGAPWHPGSYYYGCCGGVEQVGSPVSVSYGTQVTAEWSCQPYQNTTHSHCSLRDPYGNCLDTYEQSVYVNWFQSGAEGNSDSGGVGGTGGASGNFGGVGGTVGSVTFTPTQSTTYSLSCSGSMGTASFSIPVTVVVPRPEESFYLQNHNTGDRVHSVTVVAAGSAQGDIPVLSVPYATPLDVSWDTSNANSCTLYKAPGTTSARDSSQGTALITTSVHPYGWYDVGSPTQTTTYTLACTDVAGGVWQSSVTASVQAPTAPTAAISASPTSVYAGQSSTVSWSSTNATSCSVSGPGVSSSALSGSQSTGALTTGTNTYSISCSGTGGSDSKSAVVSVSTIPPTCSGSFCSFGYTPGGSVLPGTAVTLSWSCNSSIYTSSSGDSHFSTGGALTGNKTVNPTETTTYSVTCIAPGGNSSASATVNVLQPSLTITASPARVKAGHQTNLTWSATNVTTGSCSVSSSPSVSGFPVSGASGSQSPTINSATTFTLRCTVPSGPVSQSVTVNLLPKVEEI